MENQKYKLWAQFEEKNYVIITPYLLPENITKKVNIGDGFIMDSIVRLIGARPHKIISSRAPLTKENIEIINESKLVLVAGANILKDKFEITPNFNIRLMEQIKKPIVLCGIGHFGIEEYTKNGLSSESVEIIDEILKRFPYISVRCDESKRYLTKSLTGNFENVLMTSCPVIYPVNDKIKDFSFKEKYSNLIVTITDRAFLDKQLTILKAAPFLFPSSKMTLALHQNYKNKQLCEYAKKIGYDVFTSENFEDFLDLYSNSDIHFGNRVHAHLKCLSLGVRSFLTPFDLRQTFFSDSLDFPLIKKVPNEELFTYDFNRVIKRRNNAEIKMNIFLESIKKYLI
jgi:hypothetical protein